MLAYAVRRLLLAVPLLLAVLLACFLLLDALPGDAVSARLGTKNDPAAAARLRHELGLDRPVIERFGSFLYDVCVRFDFGENNHQRSINEALRTHVPATIELALLAMVIATVVGISAGTLSAARAGRARDAALMTASLAGVSLPIFWLGLLVQRFFRAGGTLADWTGFAGLEVTGRLSAANQMKVQTLLIQAGAGVASAPTGFYLFDSVFIFHDGAMFLDALSHLALPALVLASVPAAMIARITRAAVGAELGEDYVRTARAKGVPARRIIRRHVLRNAAIAITTTLGSQLGYLLGGAVLTETIFQWPGIGRYIVDAIERHESRELMAAVLLVAVTFVVINLVVDLSYALLDPRVRVGGGAGDSSDS